MYQKCSEIVNLSAFRLALYHYVENVDTDHNSIWRGRVSDDSIRIERKKHKSNFSRPQIKILLKPIEGEKAHLNISVQLPNRVQNLVMVSGVFSALIGLLTLNLNFIFMAPIISLILFGICWILFSLESEQAKKDVDRIVKVAGLKTFEEILSTLKKDH